MMSDCGVSVRFCTKRPEWQWQKTTRKKCLALRRNVRLYTELLILMLLYYMLRYYIADFPVYG